MNESVAPQEAAVTYYIEEEVSQRGKRKLISSSGYTYTVKVYLFDTS